MFMATKNFGGVTMTQSMFNAIIVAVEQRVFGDVRPVSIDIF